MSKASEPDDWTNKFPDKPYPGERMSDQLDRAVQNTDRELWREPHPDPPGSYYANLIHVTAQGGIGINVSGTVIVKPLRQWHALAAENERLEGELAEARKENEGLNLRIKQLQAEDEQSHVLCVQLASRLGVTSGERDEARKRCETLETALQYILETRTLCNSDKCAYRNHDLPSCPYGKARAALASEQEGTDAGAL